MKRTTRYILIAAGFLVFFVLAPVLLLYVTGYKFDWDSSKYLKTGIISVVTDPRGAEIYLDDEKRSESPATMRFLSPKEYQITISKQGYNSWSKRLAVEAGKVTSAAVEAKVYLLLKDKEAEIISSGVVNFAVTNDKIFFLTKDSLVVTERKNLKNSAAVKLPFPTTELIASTDQRYLLLRQNNQATVFDVNAQSFYDISKLLLPGSEAQFTDTGRLIVLQGGTLQIINWGEQTKISFLENVRAFTAQNNNLYYLQNAVNKTLTLSSALIADLPALKEQGIIANLPSFQSVSIVATNQRELFILGDRGFYAVGSELIKLASEVTSVNVDPLLESLTLSTPAEIYYYDFDRHKLELVTRSTGSLTSPLVDPATGYAFFIAGDQLTAVELDLRDKQNNYSLIKTTASAKFAIDNDNENIYLLDTGQLKVLKIR